MDHYCSAFYTEKVVKPISKSIQQIDKQTQYQGYTIVSNDGLHRVNNAEFRQIEHAKEYIDMLREQDEMIAKIADMSTLAIPQPVPVEIQYGPAPKPILLKTSEPVETSKSPESDLIEYNGKVIKPTGDKFICNGIPFNSLNAAQNYVDNFASVPSKALPGLKRP